MTTARNRGLMLALAGLALLLAADRIAYRVPRPLAANASMAEFSADRAKAILGDLTGGIGRVAGASVAGASVAGGTGAGVDAVAARPIGSPADAQIREAIVKRLSALGYSSELQRGWVCNDAGACGSPVNIVATLGATSEGTPKLAEGDAVLLAAHYDSVAAGPGAADDGAAVATVLEIARILAARPGTRHPVVLLLTDGEEAGLLGAALFVRDHPFAKRVKAAVNLEARGTSGLSLMFESGDENSWLMRLYGAAVARPVTNSLFYTVYKLLPNDTDFTVFKAAGYQGFNFAFIGNVGRYHTPLDNAANLSASSVQHQGDNALAVLTALANSPTLQAPVEESVFFDVFARAVISWPATFSLPASLVVFALLLAEVVVLMRTGVVGRRGILWGLAGAVACVLASAIVCAGSLAGLIALGKVPPIGGASWIAHPLPMHIASAAMALLCVGTAGSLLARRAGFWGFWTAATLLSALLCIACSAAAPGASFALLLTVMAAVLGGLPATLQRMKSHGPSAGAADAAALLPALVMFGATFPLVQFLYIALGSPAWPLSSLLLGLVGTHLLALFALAARRARRRVAAVSGLAAALGVVATFGLPAYSPQWPQRINVEYWFDADTGRSHYLVQPDSMRLPGAMAAAADFDRQPRPRFAGSGSLGFYAPAATMSLAVPELTLISERPSLSQTATHFELALHSVRGAPEAIVVFPASARVTEAQFATAAGPVHAKLAKLDGGSTVLDLVGLDAAGVQFSIDAAGALPIAVQVMDQSYGAPQAGTLLHARPPSATSSQDGDITVVHRTVSLSAAGR